MGTRVIRVGREAGGQRHAGHEDAQPPRCQSCSSTSCCIARTRSSSYEGVPLEARVLDDVNDHIVDMMDDPSTLWYWQLVYGVATRARARVARTRGNEN